MDELTRLFGAYDSGTLSRRQLFQALGIAAVASTPFARRAFAQGQCAGRDRDTTAACNHTPMKPPFEPTGWKTVALDHFTMQTTDPEKEAAFYVALMGWKVRSNENGVIDMDMGDLGGVKIRGGYTPPPGGGRFGGGGGGGRGRGGAPGDSAARGRGAGAGGAGRGAGAGAAGGGRVQYPPCTNTPMPMVPNSGTLWDGFAWGITPWDTNKVEAALKARGLNPVAAHSGNDYKAFLIKDPDGMNLWITNATRQSRRRTPANGKLNVPLPFEPTGWQTKYLDHISYGVTSYKETVAFYEALLGWKGLGDEGSQNETVIAPEIGGLLIRGGNALSPEFQMPATRTARMDHISFGITPFDPDTVNAELCKRGLVSQVDTGSIASSPESEKDIHTSTYKSFHTRTPNNFNLQFSSKISQDQHTGPA